MKWEDKINNVFTTRPRNGTAKGILWVEREEQKLFKAYLTQEDHICIDGPTGSGKSSLVITNLYREQIKHISIQLTEELTWKEFCRHLIDPAIINTSSIGAEFEIGLDKGLPHGKLSISLGASGSDNDDLDYLIKQTESWTEHNLCQKLKEQDLTLVLDDVERCNDKLLKRLSDVAKILIQSYSSKNAKLIFIGAGGVMPRLLKANPSLDDRINHISIGAFRDRSYSWHFLLSGFDQLEMRHPANSKFNTEREARDKCVKMTYYAADGLPKSLNRLGKNISLSSGFNKHASAATIIRQSQKMFQDHWRTHSQEYTTIANLLRTDPVSGYIVRSLWDNGIGAVHKVDFIENKIIGMKDSNGNRIDVEKYYQSLNRLIDNNFLTLSGASRDIVFASDPASAHTFGVAMHNRSLFDGAIRILNGLTQLEIDFTTVND